MSYTTKRWIAFALGFPLGMAMLLIFGAAASTISQAIGGCI